jgi:[ribosomal protein S5]-alanine N-acetyltransferase
MSELRGKSIFLRPLTESDANETYVGWLNDPAVNQYLETRFTPQTIEAVRAFVREKMRSQSEYLFGICLVENGRHIGNIKLGPVNAHHKSADISLFLGDRSSWGKGFAKEAIGLITRWGFLHLGLEKLKAGCYAANEGSARAFEYCGYSREGLLRDQLQFQGKPMDLVLLGLRRKDFDDGR